MSHERKKNGQRKDKKMERMHQDVAERKMNAHPHPTTDQKDLQTFKPGSPADQTRHLPPPQSFQRGTPKK